VLGVGRVAHCSTVSSKLIRSRHHVGLHAAVGVDITMRCSCLMGAWLPRLLRARNVIG
jgi:hypothetical protein